MLADKDKRRQANPNSENDSTKKNSTESVELSFSAERRAVTKHLGAEAPIMRLVGGIGSPEDEKSLMNMWLKSRSNVWQWFDSPKLSGKMLIHELALDRKSGSYFVDMQKYSGNEF